MPRKPKVPCLYPGCSMLVDAGYCIEHKRKRDKEYNKFARDEDSKSFYSSKRWNILRREQLRREPFCEEYIRKAK